jgi:hypothetical protein
MEQKGCWEASVLFPRLTSVSATLCGLLIGLVGCGGAHVEDTVSELTVPRTKKLLLALPHRYDFRVVDRPQGAYGAVAGRAYGRHHTYIDFGISLGAHPAPIPVQQAGVSEAESFPEAGFVFTANVLVQEKNGGWVAGRQLLNHAQWREANRMVTEMEQRLCQATTGGPCTI